MSNKSTKELRPLRELRTPKEIDLHSVMLRMESERQKPQHGQFILLLTWYIYENPFRCDPFDPG